MKLTKNYVRKLIREQLENMQSLEQEGAMTGVAAGVGLTLFTALAGMSAKQQVDRFGQIMQKVQADNRGWDELSRIYMEKTGSDPKADNMDLEDLKIFAAGGELKK